MLGSSDLSYARNFRTAADRCGFSDLIWIFSVDFIFVRKPPCTKCTKIKSIWNILDLQYLMILYTKPRPRRAVEHNRRSGFNLCYCQLHGLEVQLSDTCVWRLDIQSIKLTVCEKEKHRKEKCISTGNLLQPAGHLIPSKHSYWVSPREKGGNVA